MKFVGGAGRGMIRLFTAVALGGWVAGCSVNRSGLMGVDAQGADTASGGGPSVGAGGGFGSGGAVSAAPGSGGSADTPMNSAGGASIGGGGGGGGAGAGAGAGGAATTPAACDASTCPNGCCNGKICVTANRNNRRCGTGGVACVACVDCFECSQAGACRVDPASLWTLTCDSATINEAPADGQGNNNNSNSNNGNGSISSGDGGGSRLPDAFCQIRFNRVAVAESTVDSNTSSPSWSDGESPAVVTLAANALLSGLSRWSVYVGDDSVGFPYPATSLCEVDPTALTESDFAAGQATFVNVSSCSRLKLKLECD